jgi:hypothetical protein
MIGKVKDAVDTEIAVAAGHALDFHFVGNVGRRRFFVDVQIDDLRADVRGQFELIATGSKAAAQIVAVYGRLL